MLHLDLIIHNNMCDNSFLEFSNHNIRDEDLNELCDFVNKIRCHFLLLDHNNITSEGVNILLEKLLYVKNIDLSYNNIDNKCLFESLKLSWNNINNQCIDILIENATQKQLI